MEELEYLYGQGNEILWAIRNHGRCVSTGVSIVDSQSWIVLRDLSIHASIYPSETDWALDRCPATF